MAIRATHELHDRRRGRNFGLAALLLAFVLLVFGLTVVKVQETGIAPGYDHVLRPEIVPQGDGQ
ncbi:MAG: hypothetical protein AAFR47_19880 [Pseudomonadota bacterium]